MGGGDERALLRRVFERIPAQEASRAIDETPLKLCCDRLLDEDARAAEADLALVQEGRAGFTTSRAFPSNATGEIGAACH